MIGRFPLPRKAIRLMRIAVGTRAVPLWEILRLTRSGRIKVFLPAFMEFIAAQHARNSASVAKRPAVPANERH